MATIKRYATEDYVNNIIANLEIPEDEEVAQSNWQENDETSPAYIQNRTHWVEENFTEAVPEINVNNTYIELTNIPIFESLSPNCNCQIILNGTVYETTAIHNSYNAYEWYVIGNGDLIGESGGDSSLPFGLFIDKHEENWGEANFNISTFQMNITSQIVHKIPEIYLPTTIGQPGTGSYSEVFNDLANNQATADYTHAEGQKTTASGASSHAEGISTIAKGYAAHAEGNSSQANTPYSHAEGWGTVASGNAAHSSGIGTEAKGEAQTAVGRYNAVDNTSLFIVGIGTNENARINGFKVSNLGDGEFKGDVIAGGNGGEAPVSLKSINNLVQNEVLVKSEQKLTDEEIAQVRRNLHLIGKDVEGQQFTIDGTAYTASPNAEIFGDYINNIAIGQWSIAEGSGTVAKGRASHAEGAYSQALQDGAHVEGYQTKATGYWSHAEGEMTTVSSYASHAEGSYCTLPNGTKRYGTASGYASHVEGGGCHTTGSCSHAEGLATTASGAQSHVEGRYTIAAGGAQHVEGIANVEDAEGKYIHIAGNGTFDARKNAYTLDWNGLGWFAGGLKIGGTGQDDTAAKEVATKEYVDSKIPLEFDSIILRSANKKFALTVSDEGILTTTEIISEEV